MNESLSTRYPSRSRAFHMPAAVRFAYLSSPPPSRALARRASYSFSSASNDMRSSFLQRFDQRGDYLPVIADDTVARFPEYRRFRVGVDRDDRLRVTAAGEVMARARDADREIEIRRHGLARKAD